MNKQQKVAFLAGVITIAAMGLCPPWKEAGEKGLPLPYGPIFAPPVPLGSTNGMEIDMVRLFMQVGVAAILSAGFIAAAAPSLPPPQSGSNTLGSSGSSGPQQIPADWKTAAAIEGRRVDEEDEDDDEDEDEVDEDEDDDEDEDVEDGPQVVRLPAGKSYGEFLVESDDDPDYWETLSEARGVVKLPLNKRVQLEIKGNKDVDLSFITMLAPGALFSVDLSESKVKDWELANLAKLTELKELDLSETGVTSQALSYLKGLDQLEKLWLDGTGVDDACVSELKQFSKLKKLSIKGTHLTEDGIKKLKEEMSNCKVEV